MRPPSGRTAVGVGFAILVFTVAALVFAIVASNNSSDTRFRGLRREFDALTTNYAKLSASDAALRECVQHATTDCKQLAIAAPQITIRTDRGQTTIVIPRGSASPSRTSAPPATPKPQVTAKPKPTPKPKKTPLCVQSACLPEVR